MLMESDFMPIDKWPDKNMHLRNVNVALAIAKGKTYAETAKNFVLDMGRILQIYRIIMCELCIRKFNLPWEEAMHNKTYYLHDNRIEIIEDYKKQYMQYKNIKKEPKKRPERNY